jgi:hypothetical protein
MGGERRCVGEGRGVQGHWGVRLFVSNTLDTLDTLELVTVTVGRKGNTPKEEKEGRKDIFKGRPNK